MDRQVDILNNVLDEIRTDVINSMQSSGRYATGETAKELQIVVTEGYGAIMAPLYIDALETGRRPTSANATPGDPPMIERIRAWCDAKGIDQKAAWAIKKSIDKKGYQGKTGVLTEPLSDDNINRRLNPAINLLANNIGKEIIDAFSLLES